MARKPSQVAEIDFKTFGKWIRQRREYTGLTQEQAARLAGVSRVYWSQIERGKIQKQLRRETVKNIANAINARPEQALEKMAYTVEEMDRVYGPEANTDMKLNRAIKSFVEILLNARSETEAAMFLMLIYREYHNKNWGEEYAKGFDPLAYQAVLRQIMLMNNYERWFLVRAILLEMEENPHLLIRFPNTPETEQFNKEQRRLLRLASEMKERQIEVTQRYEQKQRERVKKR
jgi:transcriptional regulator with XRE-family HTH domain